MRDINNIDKDFLINLFSTATYNSDWLVIRTLVSERHLDNGFTERYCLERCREEKWADRLLAGGHIVCYDLFEEDEDDQRHEIDLVRIKDGIKKAMTEAPHDLADFIEENDDYFTCSNLMQVILYGEVIYC